MAISAKDVQKLREMTGVGMMDCKKALTEANGDFDKAIEWLREKGLAAQTKKAGKIAAEGVSYAITADNGVGVVIEVNSQTDFVAKNEVFQGFVKDLATIVANENPADVEALKACTYPGTDRTVADVTADKVTPAPTAPWPTSPPTRCWPSARTSRSAASSAMPRA